MAMKRRDFLRATLVTAGAVLAPAACTTEDVKTSGACTVEDGAAYFPQSVASGDPRTDSVILWTRVEDPDATGDVDVQVKVALDPELTQIVALTVDTDSHATVDEEAGGVLASVVAQTAFDRCVKVKVAGLSPGTTYYYQFYYANAAGCFASRVGRTKTAPAEEDDVPVRFAYVSCQDFIGRYYNAYLALAQEELDFVVCLGDYIYETTGDPGFQNPTEDRKVELTDVDGAIALTTASMETYYAARSLHNYRELYRIFRSDPALQAVHERFPMIVTWDDHEYSDDCHGAVASYTDGREDETNVERRKAANKAWFEYQPVDYVAGDDFRYDEAADYPLDITIYRDFTFGKHLHLVMTDLRTYRADHLVPEEAFPGTVVLTEAALTAGGQPLPAAAAPYVNIDDPQWAAHKAALRAAAEADGYPADQLDALASGDISVAFANAIGQAQTPPLTLIDPATPGLERGIAYLDIGKNGSHTAIGSRYLLVKEGMDLLGEHMFSQTSGASEMVMGNEQETWFLDTMTGSTRTWKVWGNEYCLIQMAVDLTGQAIPDEFKKQFYMNCDAWDGFRNKRSELIEKLSAIPNVVAITGDIHAFYAGTPMANNDPTRKIVEFVGSSITSKTFKEELLSQVENDPVLSQVPNVAQLAALIDTFLKNAVNPHLAYANSGDNGFCVAEVSAAEMVVTMHQIPAAEVSTNYADTVSDLLGKVEQVRFKAVAGENDLYMEDDTGAWLKWDPTTRTWV